MATDERKTGRRSSSTRSSGTLPARRDDWSGFWNDPFALWSENPMQRFAREMDRWFHGGRDPREGRSLFGSGGRNWNPELESFQRGDEFVIRADLPGMKRDEISVNITDDSLTIEGERRDEHEEHKEGLYRSERSYGRFQRTISLPEGSIPETTRATFQNGVLEITIQAPPREVSRGRRVDIADAANGSSSAGSTRTPPSGTIYPG